jgi:hypothetical protein
MKILITQEQFNLLNETKKEKVYCSKCDHSWEIEKKDKHPHLCHMCGYDSKSKKHNYEELENFWKNYKKEEVTEKWSEKYKKSINCNNPKGFSQRAHCQGRKKHLKENFENPEIFKSSIEKNLKEYTSNYEWLDSIGAEFTTTSTSAGWKNEYDTPLCMYKVKFNSNKTPSYEQQRSLFEDISFVHSMFFPREDGKPTCYFSTLSEYPSGDIKSFPSFKTMSENKEDLKMARRQGSGLRFSKSAIKANPSRLRKYSRLQESKTPETFKSSIEKNLKEYTSNYEWLDGIEISVRETNWLTEKQKPVYEYGVKFKNTSMVSYKEQENLFDDIMFVHTMFFPVEDNHIDCYMSVKSIYPNGDEGGFPSTRTMSENKEDLKLIHGYDLDKIKKALKILSQISDSFGEYIPLNFKLYGYEVKGTGGMKIMVLYIDVDSEDGVYDTMSRVWYEISQQLLEIFQMMGIRDEIIMYPLYDFKFNKRPLENITII